jgi:hypothetical protein
MLSLALIDVQVARAHPVIAPFPRIFFATDSRLTLLRLQPPDGWGGARKGYTRSRLSL